MDLIKSMANIIIPLTLLVIISTGFIKKVNCFDVFLDGVLDGLKVCTSLLPSLIGLMVAVGLLRVSGALDLLCSLLTPVIQKLSFPAPLVPLVFIKMFSTSAATSVLIDIFKQFGTDSHVGFLASVIMCPTETIMYILAIYFGAMGIKNTRYVIPGALLVTITGVLISCFIVV